jgi:hypothetical protein
LIFIATAENNEQNVHNIIIIKNISKDMNEQKYEQYRIHLNSQMKMTSISNISKPLECNPHVTKPNNKNYVYSYNGHLYVCVHGHTLF